MLFFSTLKFSYKFSCKHHNYSANLKTFIQTITFTFAPHNVSVILKVIRLDYILSSSPVGLYTLKFSSWTMYSQVLQLDYILSSSPVGLYTFKFSSWTMYSQVLQLDYVLSSSPVGLYTLNSRMLTLVKKGLTSSYI